MRGGGSCRTAQETWSALIGRLRRATRHSWERGSGLSSGTREGRDFARRYTAVFRVKCRFAAKCLRGPDLTLISRGCGLATVSGADSVPVRVDQVPNHRTGGRANPDSAWCRRSAHHVGQAQECGGVRGVHRFGRPPLVHFLVAASGAIHDEVFQLHEAPNCRRSVRSCQPNAARANRDARTAVRDRAPALRRACPVRVLTDSDDLLSPIARLADCTQAPIFRPQRPFSSATHPSRPSLLPSHGRVLTIPRHVQYPNIDVCPPHRPTSPRARRWSGPCSGGRSHFTSEG